MYVNVYIYIYKIAYVLYGRYLWHKWLNAIRSHKEYNFAGYPPTLKKLPTVNIACSWLAFSSSNLGPNNLPVRKMRSGTQEPAATVAAAEKSKVCNREVSWQETQNWDCSTRLVSGNKHQTHRDRNHQKNNKHKMSKSTTTKHLKDKRYL